MTDIPDDIVAILRERVTSLEQLELLLRMSREPARWWLADEAASSLGAPPDMLEPALVELAMNSVLERRGSGLESRWRYAPRTAELRASLERLIAICDERRLEIMRVLSAQAMDRIRDSAARAFADAFIIGRKRDG